MAEPLRKSSRVELRSYQNAKKVCLSLCSSGSGSDHGDDDDATCQDDGFDLSLELEALVAEHQDGVDVRREPEALVAERQGGTETQKTETQEDGTFLDSETSANDAKEVETKEGETKEDGDTKRGRAHGGRGQHRARRGRSKSRSTHDAFSVAVRPQRETTSENRLRTGGTECQNIR